MARITAGSGYDLIDFDDAGTSGVVAGNWKYYNYTLEQLKQYNYITLGE